MSRRTQRRSRRRLRFEPLEDRRLMADLAIGLTLATTAGPVQQSVKVGAAFTLDVAIHDARIGGQTPVGVISLPLHVSWDPVSVALTGNPSGVFSTSPVEITSSFPLQRQLIYNPTAREYDDTAIVMPNDFLPFANLQGLRAAAVPNFGVGVAIGANTTADTFSKLTMTAIRATADARFTVALAGSMSFADAAVLNSVVPEGSTQGIPPITVQTQLRIDPVIISGMKFDDQDKDGVKDGSESGLGNWTIQLIRDQDNNGAIDPTDPVRTTTTDADGAYTFEVTEAGTYFVRELQQAGCIQTTLNPAPFPLSGVDVAGVDFGNNCEPPVSMSSLSGFVFADPNLNGKFDVGEDGLPKVTVRLLRTDVVNAPAATTLTGPDGWYHFEDLSAGTYEIREEQPQGFVNSINSLGILCGAMACLPATDVRNGAVNGDRFTGIMLQAGEHAVDYNFGDNIIPTKRRFVASVDPFAETCALLKLNCVTVRGTTGNDQIEFVPDTEEVRVTVNNQPAQVFSRATVNIVKIDALAGQDTVTLRGSSTNDVAHSQSNSCTIQTGSYLAGDYAVLAVNAERTIVDGGLGNDLAVLRDSAVDDVLTTTNDPFIGPVTELESALNMQRFVRAIAFERTRAVSIPNRGSDTAVLNGLPVELVGDWSIIG